MPKIEIGSVPEFSWQRYYDNMKCGEELAILRKPCGDCAVVCGMYREFSDGLKTLSTQDQRKHSASWFCHNSPGHACAGNLNNLGVTDWREL